MLTSHAFAPVPEHTRMRDVALWVQDDVLAHRLRQTLEHMALQVTRDSVAPQETVARVARKPDLRVVHLAQPMTDFANHACYDQSGAQATASLALLPESHMAFASAVLDAGFDRCLPVSVDEATLCAMVRALTRRQQGLNASVCHYGALSFNHAMRQACVAGRVVDLTSREAQVVDILLKRVGQIISKERFIQDMAPHNMDLNTTVVEVYIHRLRKKIGHDILPIRNIKRCGYLLPRYPEDGRSVDTHAVVSQSSDDLIRARYEFVGAHLAV